jgi:transcription antitermination protein NusB
VSLAPQKFREIVLQLLFSYEFQSDSDDELLAVLMKEHKVTKNSIRKAQELAKKIIANKEQVDALIKKVSYAYDLDRIHSVERNILRVLLFEHFIDKSLPDKVAVAEAMRLAKKFSTEDAAGFVQALISALLKQEKNNV